MSRDYDLDVESNKCEQNPCAPMRRCTALENATVREALRGGSSERELVA